MDHERQIEVSIFSLPQRHTNVATDTNLNSCTLETKLSDQIIPIGNYLTQYMSLLIVSSSMGLPFIFSLSRFTPL